MNEMILTWSRSKIAAPSFKKILVLAYGKMY